MDREGDEGPSRCLGGCGFFGSETTNWLCSKCFKSREQTPYTITHVATAISHAATTSSMAVVAQVSSTDAEELNEIDEAIACKDAALKTEVRTMVECGGNSKKEIESDPSNQEASTGEAGVGKKNRCNLCNRRVGLLGFTCRCEGVFCAEHRYHSVHSCTFDYKSMEREQIRKKNPTITAEKINRI